MKKKSLAFLRNVSHEQSINEGFQPFDEQQQKAKSGITESFVGGDAGLAAVAASDPKVAKASTIMAEAFKAVADDVGAIVKSSTAEATRRVYIIDQAHIGAAFTAANAVTGTDFAGNITPDNADPGPQPHTNAVSNGTGISTALNSTLATAKPRVTPATIVDAAEDEVIAAKAAEAELATLTFVDQTGKTVKVLSGTEADIEDAIQAALAVSGLDVLENYAIDTTNATSSVRQYGE